MKKEYSDARARLRVRVMNKINEHQFNADKTVKDLAEALHERLALSQVAAATYISKIRRGLQPGYSTEHGRGVPFTRLESSRLSMILEHIGVGPSDKLIKGLRREIPSFEYPCNGSIPFDRRRKYVRAQVERAINYSI